VTHLTLPADQQRAIALDLDGVLIDGMRFHIAAWRSALADISLNFDDNSIYELEGSSTQTIIDRLNELYGWSLPSSERQRLVAVKRERYAEMFTVLPINGASDCVNRALSYGYRVAVVTGAPRRSAYQALDELGLRESVTTIVGAEDCVESKPSPAPYRRAQTELGVRARCCLVVENAPLGLEAAKFAGMPCLGLPTYLPAKSLNRADRVVRTLAELSAWLASEHRLSGGVGEWLIEPSVVDDAVSGTV